MLNVKILHFTLISFVVHTIFGLEMIFEIMHPSICSIIKIIGFYFEFFLKVSWLLLVLVTSTFFFVLLGLGEVVMFLIALLEVVVGVVIVIFVDFWWTFQEIISALFGNYLICNPHFFSIKH